MINFDYVHEFSRIEVVDGERLDLALRITKVHSALPVTFIMSDCFLHHDGESRFCEAYLSDGSPAIEPGFNLIEKKTFLTDGAAVFLRGLPITWWETNEVVEKLVALVKKHCKVDKGAQVRENLTEAMSQMFDILDTAERLLRRNRNPVTVNFSDATAAAFIQYLVEFDGAVLSVSKKPLEPGYTAVVLIEDKHQQPLLERLGLPAR